MINDIELKNRLSFVTDAVINVITGGLEILFSDDEADQMPNVLAEIAATIGYNWDGSECCIVYDCLPEEEYYVIRIGDERVK